MKETYNLEDGFHMANNICDLIDDDELDAMGANVLQQVREDITSREGWLDQNDMWMELVTQVIEAKQYPWPDASNVKFPLISTAAVQFHARSFPALLGGNRPVKCRVLGRDEGNVKAERAERLSTFLSFQVTEAMEEWMDDMDRMLFILPIIGSLYKKTYFDESKSSIVSELIHPRDLIINYDALNIKDARKTHRQWYLPNRIIEMQNRGLWREVKDDGEEEEQIQPTQQHSVPRDKAHELTNPSQTDDFSLQEVYEVHCLLDLDDDGYKEPYVLTVRAIDGKIYRIVANYDDSRMELDAGGSVLAITPNDYFTHYHFLPDPESKTHGLGFGTMIGPINEAVNTLINILTDAGHMHSLGGGFLARGVRLKGGAVKFRPSEWKPINTTGDDLRKGIFPLPTKEPSTVLFQMLGMLIDAGKDLSSVQDQMVGRTPGQNTPFSTTQSVMEQGMKVFNGIYKRIYRSMTKEFKKIYNLNRKFPDMKLYMTVLDIDGMDIKQAMSAKSPNTGKAPGLSGVLEFLSKDFNGADMDVSPSAEPDMIAEMEKIMKANSLLQKLSSGIPLNVMEVTKRVLEAEGHENVSELMKVPPPQVPPEAKLEQAKFQWQQKKEQLELQSKLTLEKVLASKTQMEGLLALAKAKNEDVQGLHAQFMEEQKLLMEEFNSVTKRIEALTKNEQERKSTSNDTGSSSGDNS